MLGPTGTGVLWMRDTVDALVSPLMIGGGTVEDVTTDGYTLISGYQRFEGGTPNISGAIGLGRAVKYLEDLGMDAVYRHEEKLTARLLSGLAGIDHVIVQGPQDLKNRIGVISFTIDKIRPHEVAYLLDEKAAIRSVREITVVFR